MITLFLKIIKMIEDRDEEFMQFLKRKKMLEEEDINNTVLMAKLIKIEQQLREKFSNEIYLELQNKAKKTNDGEDILKIFNEYSKKIMQDSIDTSNNEPKRA